MRLPWFMVVAGPPERTRAGIKYTLRVRKVWLWWLIARTAWRAIKVRPAALKPAVWLWVVARLIIRRCRRGKV